MKILIQLLVALIMAFLLESCCDTEYFGEQGNKLFYETRSANNSLDGTLEYLRQTRLGGALWWAATERLRMSSDLMLSITFRKGKWLNLQSMVYEGNGFIYYNFDNENSYEFGQLAIHELFHIYQNGRIPLRILNNEIEAYLVQYIFLVSENEKNKFQAATLELTKCIINLNSGNIISDKYEECYWAAMRALKKHHSYQDTDEVKWKEIPSSDMSNLRDFLQNL